MLTWFRQRQQIRRFANITFLILLGVVSSLIATVIAANYTSIAGPVGKFILVNLGWLIAFVILLISSISINLYRDIAWRRDREIQQNVLTNLNTTLDTLNTSLSRGDQLFEIVNSSLNRLPDLIATKNLLAFIKELVADATKVAPNVYGGSLYQPDATKEWLTIFEAYQVPEDSKRNAKCYIGPQVGIKRGLAGECFLDKKVLVTHKTNQLDENGDWKFDRESYMPFTKSGIHPAFESFVCIPILTKANDCLGVLCLDSGNLTAFDSIAFQKTLEQLGRYVALILLISSHIVNLTK